MRELFIERKFSAGSLALVLIQDRWQEILDRETEDRTVMTNVANRWDEATERFGA